MPCLTPRKPVKHQRRRPGTIFAAATAHLRGSHAPSSFYVGDGGSFSLVQTTLANATEIAARGVFFSSFFFLLPLSTRGGTRLCLLRRASLPRWVHELSAGEASMASTYICRRTRSVRTIESTLRCHPNHCQALPRRIGQV
jgi:hypothetical protein